MMFGRGISGLAFVRLDALRTEQLSLSDARTAAYGSDWDRLVRVRRFR
jgi:hypothetical protein